MRFRCVVNKDAHVEVKMCGEDNDGLLGSFNHKKNLIEICQETFVKVKYGTQRRVMQTALRWVVGYDSWTFYASVTMYPVWISTGCPCPKLTPIKIPVRLRDLDISTCLVCLLHYKIWFWDITNICKVDTPYSRGGQITSRIPTCACWNHYYHFYKYKILLNI